MVSLAVFVVLGPIFGILNMRIGLIDPRFTSLGEAFHFSLAQLVGTIFFGYLVGGLYATVAWLVFIATCYPLARLLPHSPNLLQRIVLVPVLALVGLLSGILSYFIIATLAGNALVTFQQIPRSWHERTAFGV